MSNMTVDQLSKQILSDLNKQLLLNNFSLHKALLLLEEGEKYAASINVPVVLTIIDGGGNLIAQHRMDQALLASIEISKAKAYTALSLQKSTEELANVIQPGQSLYGLQDTCPGKFCFFGGGIPLYRNNMYIGAVGVSGGTVEQDTLIAKHMVSFFLRQE
ncbi:MAG: heme-binding protein [bacterium]|nr:heme-binding protein [bacterium]